MNRLIIPKHFIHFFIIFFITLGNSFAKDSKILNFHESRYLKTADSLLVLAAKYVSIDNEIAKMYAEKGYQLFEGWNYWEGEQNYFLVLAKIAYYEDRYNDALEFLDSLQNRIPTDSVTIISANYYYWMSAVNSCLGNYREALNYTFKSIDIRENIEDWNGVAMCTNYVGNIYMAQLDFVNAERYFKKALEQNKKTDNSNFYGNILICIGKLKEKQDSLDVAMDLYEEAYELFLQNGDLRRIAMALIRIASVQINLKEFESSESKLKEAENIYSNLNEKYGIVLAYNLLSENYLKDKNLIKAIEFSEKAYEIANEINSNPLKAESLLWMSKAYKATGNLKKALQSFEDYEKINTELISRENNQRILNLEVSSEMKAKENKLNVLLQENKIRKMQMLILLIVSGVAILCTVSLVLLLRLKHKNLKQKNEIIQDKNKLIQVENQLHEQKQETLENNIELKNKELATKALALLQLNEALLDIGTKVNEIKFGKCEKDKEAIKEILQEIQFATHSNIWEEFDLAFNKVHHSFYDRLLEICPNLTSTEIRIAALLKLNLSTKEIASISFKSESAVKVSRHRIRNKLGLPPDENLISFLLKI